MSFLDAVQVGGDEGMECVKAMLWAHGEAGSTWTDQPWFYSVLIGSVFRVTGNSIVAARLLSVVFAGLLVVEGARLCSFRRLDYRALFVFLGCWLSMPDLLELNVSIMLELPTFALMVSALAFLRRWGVSGRNVHAFAAGLLVSTAVQFKLTALIFAPGFLLELMCATLWRQREAGSGSVGREGRLGGAGWLIMGSTLSIGVGFLVVPAMPFQAMYVSHVRSLTNAAFQNPNFLSFPLEYYSLNRDLIVGGVLASGILLFSPSRRLLALPLVLLLSATAAHYHHRPWWSYYAIHFAIPLCVLFGMLACQLRWKPGLVDSAEGRLGLILRSALLALISSGLVLFGFVRFSDQAKEIASLSVERSDPMMEQVRKYLPKTHLFFSRHGMYAAHLGLRMPPEIALLPAKRLWSGQITEERIAQVLVEQKPEQLVLTLTSGQPLAVFRPLLTESYTEVYREDRKALYVLKEIASGK